MKKIFLILGAVCLIGLTVGIYSCAVDEAPAVDQTSPEEYASSGGPVTHRQNVEKKEAIQIEGEWFVGSASSGYYKLEGNIIDAVIKTSPPPLFYNTYPIYIISYYGDSNPGGPGGPGGDPGGPGGGDPPPITDPNLTVSLPNGYCVTVSIAAALQAKFGQSASTAISNARNALLNNGIDPYPPSSSGPTGIPISLGALLGALQDLGFAMVGPQNPPAILAQSHFFDGGWGMATIGPGIRDGLPIGHQVFLTWYNPATDMYTYYDGTESSGKRYGTIRAQSISALLIQ